MDVRRVPRTWRDANAVENPCLHADTATGITARYKNYSCWRAFSNDGYITYTVLTMKRVVVTLRCAAAGGPMVGG